MVTKREINVENVNGSLIVSAIVKGHRVKKQFVGHTRSYAVNEFLKQVNETL